MKPAHCQSPGSAHTSKPRWHAARKVPSGHIRTLRRRNCRSRSHPSYRQIPSIRERILEPGTDAENLEPEEGRYGGSEIDDSVEETGSLTNAEKIQSIDYESFASLVVKKVESTNSRLYGICLAGAKRTAPDPTSFCGRRICNEWKQIGRGGVWLPTLRQGRSRGRVSISRMCIRPKMIIAAHFSAFL